MSALVEGKNAHGVRKHLGHAYIPARFARECLSPFLNFHRLCLFATETRHSRPPFRHSRSRGNDD